MKSSEPILSLPDVFILQISTGSIVKITQMLLFQKKSIFFIFPQPEISFHM